MILSRFVNIKNMAMNGRQPIVMIAKKAKIIFA